MLHALFLKGSLIKKSKNNILLCLLWEPLPGCETMHTYREPCHPGSHCQKCVMNYKPQRYRECGHSSSNFHIWPCNHIEWRQTIIYTYYPYKTSGSTCSILRPAGQKVSLQKRLPSWARLLKRPHRPLDSHLVSSSNFSFSLSSESSLGVCLVNFHFRFSFCPLLAMCP